MKHIIGIDGGGTKTHLKAADLNLNIIGESFSGSSNILSNEEAVVKNNIEKLLFDFYKATNLDKKDCLCVCIGSAGVSGSRAVEGLNRILVQLLPQSKVIVTDDCTSALYGGTLTGCGIVVISGTGSICYGKNKTGVTHRVGGWGHIIGDEGSAYDIAVKSLNAIAKSYDGRVEKTLLTSLVYDFLKITNHKELIDFCYRKENTKVDIAKIAFLCDKASLLNDVTAIRIIDNSADELAKMVLVTANKIGISNESFDCVYTGGCIVNSKCLQTSFEKKVKIVLPKANICSCKQDAAYGCVKFALENIKT